MLANEKLQARLVDQDVLVVLRTPEDEATQFLTCRGSPRCGNGMLSDLLQAPGILTDMPRTDTPWGPWEPASPAEVAQIFKRSRARWWIAGGYASNWQPEDRSESTATSMSCCCGQTSLWCSKPWRAGNGTRPTRQARFAPGCQAMPVGVHDIWCRPGTEQPWRIQVMLDESRAGDWVCRRDQRIRRPIASIGSVTADGIHYLTPEIQLFYKARNPRPKDEIDFAVMLPMLSQAQRQWLGAALRLTYGLDHRWCARLH